MSSYEVRGCKAEFGNVESWPLSLQEDIDKATWFGVYETQDDGTQGAVADFFSVDRAREFAAWLDTAPWFVKLDFRIDPGVGAGSLDDGDL